MPVPRLRITQAERRWADKFLKENGLSGRLLVGAAPGASFGQAKRWPPDAFATALTLVAKKHKTAALILGGPDDTDACDAVQAGLAGVESLNLCNKLTLGESMTLMGRCALFISNDSGPMHLAAALGAATVAVFGSTDAALTGPLGKHVSVITNAIECSPCFKRECKHGHYKCLTTIDPASVATQALALMKKAKKT